MFQRLPTLLRHFAILSALASAICWMEESAIAQNINVGYAEGPAIRGTNMAVPLPSGSPGYGSPGYGSPGYGSPMQQPRMIHPSASPYLFQSGTSNNVIHTGANVTASFPVTGPVDVPPESINQLGY